MFCLQSISHVLDGRIQEINSKFQTVVENNYCTKSLFSFNSLQTLTKIIFFFDLNAVLNNISISVQFIYDCGWENFGFLTSTRKFFNENFPKFCNMFANSVIFFDIPFLYFLTNFSSLKYQFLNHIFIFYQICKLSYFIKMLLKIFSSFFSFY